jgi:carbonic anhydrase
MDFSTDVALRRRTALRLSGLAVLALAGCESRIQVPAPTTTAAGSTPPRSAATTGAEALDRLNAGNQRFASGQPQHPDQSAERRVSEVASQSPSAVVLSCVDSRMPPEIVFDQGLGDLFVARTAGEVLDNAVVGSIQFGVQVLGSPLIAVIGHQDCGAIKSTIDVVEGRAQPTGTDLDHLVQAITPAVLRAKADNATDLQLTATRYNVQDIVAQLRQTPLLAGPIAKGTLQISGGYYDIASGRVNFFV